MGLDESLQYSPPPLAIGPLAPGADEAAFLLILQRVSIGLDETSQ